jgi:hypothetical protein
MSRLLPHVLVACLLLACPLVRGAEPSAPPFPRIGNCYGAGLGYKTWEEGRPYWAKLGLIVGGCYDLHYDWENPRWTKALTRVEENIARLRAVNRHVLVLPYVDMIEGPDNPNVPQHWWDRDARGQRWSGWPGMLRINTKLEEVLRFNLDKVRTEVIGRPCFDGVFYDCWKPEPWLVPRTAELRGGKAVVMLNAWNLPRQGFQHLNGCLAEDEFNRVIDGHVEFDEFLGRYLRWCNESRRPAVTMLVGHPQSIEMNAWRWAKLTWKERSALRDKLERADLKSMRFGLATALMGDGYFGFDCGDMGRGDWWWYPEYDAPLGQPAGPAQRQADGTWQRQFQGGRVVVNGTLYDAVVSLDRPARDVSTGRIVSRLTLPMFDGRILLPAPGAAPTGDDRPPRVTLAPPATLRVAELDDQIRAVQTPAGLDLRFGPHGQLLHIVRNGRRLLCGGWPTALNQPHVPYTVEGNEPPAVERGADWVQLRYVGRLVEGTHQVQYTETCRVTSPGTFTLRFEFKALTDLDLRMWRHWFALPVTAYAGAEAAADGQTITLPKNLDDKKSLLPATRKLSVEHQGMVLEIETSTPATLIDHRRYGSDEYLLPAYPVAGKVPAGREWSFETTVSVR